MSEVEQVAGKAWQGGAGYGHGGAVGAILNALPLDVTFHVTDCGYDDNGGRCGCYNLPSTLRDIVASAQAEVANAFVAWAAANEIAEPPLDWAWFGEIARRYSPLHEESAATGAAGVETEVREVWAIRWSDGDVSGGSYSGDGSDYAEQMVRQAAGDDEVVHRTETITRTPWVTAQPAAAPSAAGADGGAGRG